MKLIFIYHGKKVLDEYKWLENTQTDEIGG